MSEYIKHHGILGMRWGKRNGPPYPLSSSIASKVSSNARRKARRTNVNTLSNDEIRKTNERIRLEKEFNSLRQSEGEKWVRSMGKTVVTGIATGVAIQIGQKYLRDKMGI